jgi:hypothetical protein
MPEITSPIESAPIRRSLPVPLSVTVVPGVVLMAIGLAIDVAVHTGVLSASETSAHLTGVLGMVLTWVAVVADGIHPLARPR